MSRNGGSKLQDSRENTWSFRRNLLPAVVLAVAGCIRLLLGHLDSYQFLCVCIILAVETGVNGVVCQITHAFRSRL